MSAIDETLLIDKLMPKRWKCPHCGRRNATGKFANDILAENFKYFEHCPHCSYVHFWQLKLTERFKKEVIRIVMEEIE